MDGHKYFIKKDGQKEIGLSTFQRCGNQNLQMSISLRNLDF
jgi:hypothetical protein